MADRRGFSVAQHLARPALVDVRPVGVAVNGALLMVLHPDMVADLADIACGFTDSGREPLGNWHPRKRALVPPPPAFVGHWRRGLPVVISVKRPRWERLGRDEYVRIG